MIHLSQPSFAPIATTGIAQASISGGGEGARSVILGSRLTCPSDAASFIHIGLPAAKVPSHMHMVYFLLLPMAMMSGAIVGSSVMENTAIELGLDGSIPGSQLRSVLLSTWLFVGVFALMARWLAWAQQKIVESYSVSEAPATPSSQRVPWLFRNRDSLVIWLWCLCQPVGLAATGWAGLVQAKTSGVAWHVEAIVLWLLPSFVLLFVLDGIRYSQYQRRLSRQGKRAESALRVMWRLAIHSWMLPIVVPVLIALLLDSVRFGALTIGDGLGMSVNNAGFGESVCVVIVAGLFSSIVLPELFVRCLDVSPVDSLLESEIRSIWGLRRWRMPKVLLWTTKGTAANAAMVGLLGPWKKLLLTDALLQRLTRNELHLVVMHELAHCSQWHAWIRLLPTVFAVGAAVLCSVTLSGWLLIFACSIVLVLFFLTLIATCWWTEFDADRRAVDLAIRYREVSDWGVHPGEHMIAALRKIHGASHQRQWNWLHPSCEHRCRAIEARYLVPDAIVGCRSEFASS